MSRDKPRIAFVLGIRPDLVRSAPLFAKFRQQAQFDVTFIWSGQHYSSNLKDAFIRDLEIPNPDVELEIDTSSDLSMISSGIQKLGNYLVDNPHESTLFLGDTNTVLLSIASSILNIPILHIEGCMRSYDIEMPEERNRRIVDKMSSRIYAYLPRYKEIGIAEGIPEESIVVTGNLAVDAVQYFMSRKNWTSHVEKAREWRSRIGIDKHYTLMTCHRRENINDPGSLSRILKFAGSKSSQVLFPASYATQRKIKEFSLIIPGNMIVVEPIEYSLFLPSLLEASRVITDSGTVVEESAILGISSVQIRRSTERPEVYWSGSSIKFDPHSSTNPDLGDSGVKKGHGLGDGCAAERITKDLNEWLFNPERIDARTPKSKFFSEAWTDTKVRP